MVSTIKISWYAVLVCFLVISIVFLQIDLWHTKHGIRAVYFLKNKLTLINKENQNSEKRNQAIYQKIKSLRNNNDQIIEGIARMELGYIKQGETFYQIVSDNGGK